MVNNRKSLEMFFGAVRLGSLCTQTSSLEEELYVCRKKMLFRMHLSALTDAFCNEKEMFDSYPCINLVYK